MRMKRLKQIANASWYRSIVVKHMLIFTFVLLTSSSVFLGFYYVFQTETMETTAELALTRNEQVFNEVNNRLNEIAYQVYELYDDGNVNLLSALWDYYSASEQAERIVKVQDYLARVRSKDNFTSAIKILMLNNQIYISPREYGQYHSGALQGIMPGFDRPVISFADDDTLHIFIRQLSQGTQYRSPNFISEVEIHAQYFKNILQALYRGDGSEGGIFVGNKLFTGTIQDSAVLTGVQNYFNENFSSAEDSKIFNLTINGNDYFCSVVKLKTFDLTLLTVRKSENIFGGMLTLFKVIPAITILNITAVIIFLIYTSRFVLQKIELQRAKLKQLQSQINPHFLYNTLFTIQTRVAYKDYNGVSLLSGLLGEYFQFLNRDSKDFITLEEEIRHTYVYAKIQAARFSERLSFIGEPCPDDIKNVLVPRLILQPLIENTIKYEVETSENRGHLHVRFVMGDKLLIIFESSAVVSPEYVAGLNDYINTDDPEREVTSTVNISRRLKLYYGNDYSLYYKISEQGTLMAAVELDQRRR